ncbi:MAG TPA: GntR family transcriptional regulator [Candidatus Limnocylindrales bacterium]|nr:GntR family transcriptional regulator [Candidatus Limnocylindrales bacterium]
MSRSMLADQVREHLLDGILSGRLAPDSRIVETQVARELGTSQAPVREALRALQAIGIVELSPFRGARVRRPTRREILEAYDVRSALEVLAARLAVGRLSDAEVTELVGLGEAMDRAARESDGHAVAAADAMFHARIVGAAGNRTLERTWRSLEPYSRTYLSLFVPGADPAWSAHLHAPIVAAIRRRDVDAVAAALDAHFREASENMAARWPEGETSAVETGESDGEGASSGPTGTTLAGAAR